jgi:hypothetical protein
MPERTTGGRLSTAWPLPVLQLTTISRRTGVLSTSALLHEIRVHTVGIDQAVNAGFLGQLAAARGGRCPVVESEDRLDAAMDAIHRRIAAPLVTGIGSVATACDPDEPELGQPAASSGTDAVLIDP